jgi:hypothetical protein
VNLVKVRLKKCALKCKYGKKKGKCGCKKKPGKKK